jgi:hypothetical protein
MDYLTVVKSLESFEKIIGYLPDEVLIEALCLLSFTFDHGLDMRVCTARSPPSAYSMTMLRVLLALSKKAWW